MATERPTRPQMLMQVAEVFSTRSTCSRAHVGVVIAKEGRILVTGYNGAPAGMAHCDHTCTCLFDVDGSVMGLPGRTLTLEQSSKAFHGSDCPATQPCKISVHAEANAIAYAAKHGVKLEGSTLYTTFTPCLPCAQLIINAGIVQVEALHAYRDMSGLELLMQAGLAVTGQQ